MKKKSLKNIVLTGLGMTTGFILYDALFQENINWGKAIFAGMLVMLITFIYNSYTKGKK